MAGAFCGTEIGWVRMADPPSIRRLHVRPPPIPAGGPVGPLAGQTDVVPTAARPDEPGDDTGGAVHGVQLVAHLLELIASEATVLLATENAGDRLAALNLRSALASWDALDQREEGLRLLELADPHPLAPRLRAMALLDDAARLEDFKDGAATPLSIDERSESGGRGPAGSAGGEGAIPLSIELAEAWLWRHGKLDRAAEIADRLLAGELPPAWRAHVVELALLAHAAAGRWPRVIELATGTLGAGSPPDEVAAAAALVLDRGSDALAALELCWSKLAHFPGRDRAALGWLRCFDVALDAAIQLGDERRFELLDKRAELIGELPCGEIEALATRLTVAGDLESQHQIGEATRLWAELADAVGAEAAGALRRYAQLRAAWAAAAGSDAEARAIKLAAHRRLADSECAEVAAAHAWRALEIAARAGDPSLAELARTVAEAAGARAAERWLDVLEIAAPDASTSARFDARGGLALRWAAAIAEQHDDTVQAARVPARVIDLWQRAAVALDALPTTHDHLARLHRGGDARQLSTAYRAWANAEPDPACASALWCARGIVDLARGELGEAEQSLQRAAELAPDDPFSRAALAAVLRATRRHGQLAKALGQLATALTSAEARAACARELAELLDEHIGDPSGARAVLERLIAERPDDSDAILALARLCERDQLWDRAIELGRRAAELAGDARRPEIWSSIARCEEQRGDRDAALAALARAAEAGHPDALRDQARIHHEAGRLDRSLEIVRAELAGDPPLARRMQLQKHLAQLLIELEREPEAVVAAYLDVLSIEPDQTEALVGIERPARALGLWDELARAFRGAPQTPRNLEVLAEALEKIAEWPELAEVRRRQLESATTNVDKAQRAAELAQLYEHQLGDVDAAIRMLVLAQQTCADEGRQQELLRILRGAGRWSDLAVALERELPTVRSADIERQVAILLELGDVRANRLNRASEAAQAYEGVLERRPDEPTATAALERLYEALGRDRELAGLLEARAAGETGAPRAQLLARVAALRAQRGDVDGSIAAYASAFAADPTNRDVFTAMERVCYKAERWAAAMQLYDRAIEFVESGSGRAYRLGDLYARRGNVQLNFLTQIDAAIESFQKVVEVDSQPTTAIRTLEDLCRRRSDWQPLITAYERRAEVQRDSQRKVDALRAAAQLVRDHVPDARQSVRINRKLLDVDPKDAVAASSLERFYEDIQDKSGLIEILKVRLQHVDDQAASVELLKRIARVSEEGARDVETATEHYLKILELQPEHRDALDALGRIYESTEQWAEFIEITRRQIKVTTDRNTKALLYFRCGSVMEAKFSRDQDALRYYEAAIKTSSSCLPAVHGLRDMYRRRQDWPLVIESLELEVKLWQDDKERAGVFAQIGGIYDKQLGDRDRAMQYYQSALSVDPDCLPANQALFEQFYDQAAWDRAQPIANALAQKAMRDGDPMTRSDFYRKRGVVARKTGDPRAAAESFIVALEIRPLNGEALDDLGALARERPDVWEFDATYRELEKVYKKREDAVALLARVHVARAGIRERDGDLDEAALLYHQALELGPGDFTVLSALVQFHIDMRRWADAVDAIQRFVTGGAAQPADRIAALMREAAIHADGELDSDRAIAVLNQVIELEPSHQDGYYVLAQQYYLSARYAEARTAIDRVIELATAQGQPLIPAALARYYYYKGRILDAAGDLRAAAPQYRRAIEYDPGYAPPALVLARRAADAGDQRQAETLLIDAAHAAMAQGGPRAAVPLQRGLARILLASGDRPAAIEAYRGILNVEPEGASDRVALAEIYAVDDPQRAIGELRKVLDRDIHHAPAYRLLASFYSRTSNNERANRVLTALDLLGFAEDTDRATMQRLRAVRNGVPLRNPLTADARARLLIAPAAREPLGDVFDALAQELSAVVVQPSLGVNLTPAVAAGEPRLTAIATEVGTLYQTEAEIFVGEKVPGLAAVTAFPRRLVVVDRALLTESDLALRFLFGYAFEAIRGGYATLLQLGARQRRELGNLLRALMSQEPELNASAAELLGSINPHAQKVLDRHAAVRDVDPGAWIDGMLACAKRAGLLACDDFHAAIWMVALLSGEQLSSHHATVALGSVLGGPDLVRFYLSDNYQQLRDLMTAS
jgi:tetratricopeptide (TPR) repeat protein